MSHSVLVMVGTKRGAFLVRSDPERSTWTVRGPVAASGWSFGQMRYDSATGAIYAAGHNAWYGAAVWKSADEGETWTLSSEGITYGDDRPAIQQVWALAPAHGALYAGADPPGLFHSEDGGANWRLAGAPLLDLPGAAAWRAGRAGLPVHSIVPHPADPQQLWIAVAGGGVLHTQDGGANWTPRNAATKDGRPALRVQKLAMAGGAPGWLYQQNHDGVFGSRDGGETWTDLTAGLPSAFGFALAAHPRDPNTLYVMPHTNEGGIRNVAGNRLAVWRSRDGGRTWASPAAGLPEGPAYVEVLRDGLATDQSEPAGIYFGTTGGQLYFSGDEGDHWTPLASHLPEILAVAAVTIGR